MISSNLSYQLLDDGRCAEICWIREHGQISSTVDGCVMMTLKTGFGTDWHGLVGYGNPYFV